MTDHPANPAPSTPAHPSGRPWYVSAILAVCAITLVLGGAWVFARIRSPFPFYGTAYDAPKQAAAFRGTDQDGRPFAFTPAADKKVTALFFGFTHCPNICPLSLAYLDKVRLSLTPAEQAQFQVVLVSVDPARDTPERLREYVTFFGKAQGVWIPEPALSRVAREYGASYQKADIKTAREYQINHTTATYLIDAEGRLRVLWDYTQLPQVERVTADVRYVLGTPAKAAQAETLAQTGAIQAGETP
ncbi:SCO family protein [Deinococcus puniceus]|uniref:Electron transporter SenC n=1 Tax=Deinococcus puniceus TaxID=1182568 RepID=A0A172T7S2_9DEIO|nr:SCO family protein [Deinococcus puniceus]ANE43041.1 electron transporter SenC [Deinococcus puniceus]